MAKNILSGIGNFFESVVTFTKDYPGVTQVVAGAVAGAFTPNQIQIDDNRSENRMNEERRRENFVVGNFDRVGDIDIGFSENTRAQQLLTKDGQRLAHPQNFIDPRTGKVLNPSTGIINSGI